MKFIKNDLAMTYLSIDVVQPLNFNFNDTSIEFHKVMNVWMVVTLLQHPVVVDDAIPDMVTMLGGFTRIAHKLNGKLV